MRFKNKWVLGYILIIFIVFSLGLVAAAEDHTHEPEGQDQMGGEETIEQIHEDADTHLHGEETLVLGLNHEQQHLVNQISYTLTVIFSLLITGFCLVLIRVTGQTEKFGLVLGGFVVYSLQSILNFIFWVTEFATFSMEFIMLQSGVLTATATFLIGYAFYQWKLMADKVAT